MLQAGGTRNEKVDIEIRGLKWVLLKVVIVRFRNEMSKASGDV